MDLQLQDLLLKVSERSSLEEDKDTEIIEIIKKNQKILADSPGCVKECVVSGQLCLNTSGSLLCICQPRSLSSRKFLTEYPPPMPLLILQNLASTSFTSLVFIMLSCCLSTLCLFGRYSLKLIKQKSISSFSVLPNICSVMETKHESN